MESIDGSKEAKDIKRILAISRNYPHKDDPSCGTFAQLQLQGIAKAGIEVDLIIPVAYAPEFIARRLERYKLFRKRIPLQFEGINAEVHRYIKLPGSWYHRWAGLANYITLKEKILKKHRENPYDLIYAICIFPEGDIAVRLRNILGIPAVTLAIGSDVNIVPNISKTIFKHYRWILESTDSILACGEDLKRKISKLVPQKPIKAVYGLVNMETFRPVEQETKLKLRKELNLPVDNKIILFIGHIIKAKGIYELTEAFQLLTKHYKDLYLVMCGDGLEASQLRKLIESKDLTSKIRLAGIIPHRDIHKWMQAADIFVLPSYSEGVPNTMMEAMGCGLPVIVTNVGGIPAAVEGSKGIILIPPKSAEDIAIAINKILQDDSLREQMSREARKTALERFDIKNNIANVLQCFQKTIARKEQIAGREGRS